MITIGLDNCASVISRIIGDYKRLENRAGII